MVALLISVLVFASYITYVLCKYGIQKSISDSYYRLTQADKWAFTIATWGYSLPLIIAGDGNPWLFLAGGLVCFVGAAPDFKGVDKGYHSFFAMSGIAVAFIWALFAGYWYIILPIVALILLLKKYVNNNTWWIEVVSYITLVSVIFMELLK